MSVTAKGSENCQMAMQRLTAREPLMKCRKRSNDVKTGRKSLAWDKLKMNL